MTGGLQQWHADFFTVQDREMQLYRARALQLASVHNNTLGNRLSKRAKVIDYSAEAALRLSARVDHTLQKLWG